jgi:hypothetical protein
MPRRIQVDFQEQGWSRLDTAIGVVNSGRPNGPLGTSDTVDMPTKVSAGQHEALRCLVEQVDAELFIEPSTIGWVGSRG